MLETQRQTLGSTHLDTLTTMNDLALTLWNLGRLDEAEALQVEVLQTRKQTLGHRHPHPEARTRRAG